MKLCITATGKNIDANADAGFGRAPWLLIIDTDTGAIIEAVENTDAGMGELTGTTAARLMSEKKVDAVLTGSVDPEVNNLFQTTGVRLFEGLSPQDTVQEAITKFKQGFYDRPRTGTSTNSSRTQGGGRGRGIAGGGRGMGGGGGQGMGGGSGQGRGMGGGSGQGRGMGGGRGRGIAGGGRGMGGGGGQGMGGGSGQGRGMGGRGGRGR